MKLTVAAAIAVLLGLGLAAAAPAQPSGDPDLAAGSKQVQDGDPKGALATLDRAVRRLSGARGREAELAQVHLWLGIAQSQLDADLAAGASFRGALRLDPSVSVAQGWPAKVMEAFAQSAQAAAGELEKAGRIDDAAAAYRGLAAARPRDKAACRSLGVFLYKPQWGGESKLTEAISTFERCVTLDPGDAEAHGALGIAYWHKAYRDPRVTDKEKGRYADLGLASVSKALELQPNLFDVMVFKGLLLRTKASVTKSPKQQMDYIRQAEGVQKQALELKNRGQGKTIAWLPPLPPRPLPTPPPFEQEPVPVLRAPAPPPPRPPSNAVRVGGEIREPKKLVNVSPDYPDIAKQARVQGIVILECTIGPDGKVTDARVLRGIPLLDQAALDAVLQWVYAPTLLNGVPVPVIMTVTVNFRLS